MKILSTHTSPFTPLCSHLSVHTHQAVDQLTFCMTDDPYLDRTIVVLAGALKAPRTHSLPFVLIPMLFMHTASHLS